MSNDAIASELGRSLSEIRNTLLKEFTKMAAPEGTFDEVSTHSMLLDYIDIVRKQLEEANDKIQSLIQEDLKHPKLKSEPVVPEVVDARESLNAIVVSCGGEVMEDENLRHLAQRAADLSRNRARVMSNNGIEANLSYSDGYKASEEIRKSLVGILEAAGKTVEPDESLFYISGRVQELVHRLTKCISTPTLEAIENGLKKIIRDAGGTVSGDETLTALATRVRTLVEEAR